MIRNIHQKRHYYTTSKNFLPRRSPAHLPFFFQAEDGIRDLTVTGVQTCALPICRERAQYTASRVAAVCASASRFIQATVSTRPLSASCATAAISPSPFHGTSSSQSLKIGRASCRERV